MHDIENNSTQNSTVTTQGEAYEHKSVSQEERRFKKKGGSKPKEYTNR